MSKKAWGLVALFLIGFVSCKKSTEQSTYDGFSWADKSYFQTWTHYLGDPHRSHFSTLDEINTTNVDQLKVAWTYQSEGMTEGKNSQIQNNPLIVGNQLFGVNAANTLFALNAATGDRIWEFSPQKADETGLGICRGFAYWPSDNKSKSRLFFSSGYYLYAIDIESGAVIPSFGQTGAIDLREDLGRDPDKLPVVMTTPGVIYKDLYIVGFRTSESPGAAPGHIRAYNVISGELAWVFHTIPFPEEHGYETWPENAYQDPRIGGANNWAGMALDEENSIVYVPTGSSAFDWYGGARIGDNLFANSLIALNADTGERIWHFQFVHHDVWDRDLPATPNLLDIERDGQKIPAVAQVTKSGHVFVFNRLTGAALFPIEEMFFPQTTLLGDTTASTQPLPLKPLPFARQQLSKDDLYAPNESAFVDDFIDHQQNEKGFTVLDRFDQVTSKGQFIPPDTLGTILYPGADGGAEWGGAAVDPRDGTMYVNSNEMAWIVRMAEVGSSRSGKGLTQIHCARCHGGNLQGLGAIPELQQVQSRLTPEEIQQMMLLGKGAMPAMPNLSEEEVATITAYLSGFEDATAEDHRAEDTGDTPYAMVGFGRFKDHRGFPVVKPPWGTLNAIDLNTGEYKWTIPLGNEEKLNDPEFPVSGTENYGGPVITAGGILFIAATKDEKFRAFHMETGALLWETDLPAGGYATPATYEIHGKQYIVLACGGGKMGTPSGDRYVAFSL
jgi:quinoprotein glucose dehydrogenase